METIVVFLDVVPIAGVNLVLSLSMPHLRQYEQQLGLSRPIYYVIDQINEYVRYHFDREHEIHWMRLHGAVTQNVHVATPIIARQLCRASLVERYDPIFGIINVHNSYPVTDPTAEAFRALVDQLAAAFAHVDIWAGDLLHTHWPGLLKTEYEMTALPIQVAVDRGTASWLEELQGIQLIAAMEAEVRRFSLEPVIDLGPIVHDMTPEARSQHDAVLAVYCQLPRLTDDRATNLNRLAESVNAVCQALNYQIRPRLIEEDGRMLWAV